MVFIGDVGLAIRFPKSVKIENTKLGVLFYLVAAGALAFVVYSFVQSKAYLTSGQVKAQVFFRPTNWHSDEATVSANLASENQDSCINPKKYEFCDVANCTQASTSRYFSDFQCVDICTDDSEHPCFEKHERWIKTESGVFFPTYFDETLVRRTPEGQRQVMKQQRIIKGVDHLAVAFDHEYTVEAEDELKRVVESGGSTPGSDAEAGVMTILKDDNGNVVSSWLPGQPVEITASMLLRVGGVSLDDLNLRAGTNFKSDSEIPVGVLMRISGVQVSIEMSYYNQQRHEENWDGPVCYLRVSIDKRWTEMSKVDTLDQHGSTRFRKYYGIQVRFTSKGSFGWVDPVYITQSLLNLFTQAVVMIGVVKKAIFLLAMYGLGYLSQVYRRFIYQQVNIGRECEGVAARLVSFSEAFHAMQDVAHGVSEQRIFQRFKKIFKYRDDLSSKEIFRIAKVFFNSMAEEEGHPIHGALINMQEFSQACCANEALTFELFAGIFDEDRKRSILENVFQDASIKRLLAGDEYSSERGWSQASVTKMLSGKPKPNANIIGMPGANIIEKKRKKRVPKPLHLVFKEADEAAAMMGHQDSESLAQEDGSSNKLLTHGMHQLKEQLRNIQDHVRRLRSEMDTLQPDAKELREIVTAMREGMPQDSRGDGAKSRPVYEAPADGSRWPPGDDERSITSVHREVLHNIVTMEAEPAPMGSNNNHDCIQSYTLRCPHMGERSTLSEVSGRLRR